MEELLSLTQHQKKRLLKALSDGKALTLRLSKTALQNGKDKLLLNKHQKKRVEKARLKGTGVSLNLSKTQLVKNRQGGLLGLIATKAATVAAPHYAKQGPQFADHLLNNFTGAKQGTIADNEFVKMGADKISKAAVKAISSKLAGAGVEGGWAWVPLLYLGSRVAEAVRGKGGSLTLQPAPEGGLGKGAGKEGGLIDLAFMALLNGLEKKRKTPLTPVQKAYGKALLDQARKEGLQPIEFANSKRGRMFLQELIKGYDKDRKTELKGKGGSLTLQPAPEGGLGKGCQCHNNKEGGYSGIALDYYMRELGKPGEKIYDEEANRQMKALMGYGAGNEGGFYDGPANGIRDAFGAGNEGGYLSDAILGIVNTVAGSGGKKKQQKKKGAGLRLD